MSSNAGILIHGKINDTHTSHMNAQYAPNNIPTPWPLVVFSLILSFIICVVGAIPAMRSVDPKYAPAPPKPNPVKPKTTTTRSSTLPPGYTPTDIELQNNPAPPYTKAVKKAPLKIPKVSWKFPIGKVIYYLTVIFCTFRAVSAFMVGLKSLHDETTPIAAPSVVLLALISTQIIHAIVNHSPITRIILALDIAALAIAFGISGYAPNGGEWWPRYSSLKITDGNCPVYAGDCMKQAEHWLSVGCGDWKTPTNYDSGVSYGYIEEFYLPYQNTGDLNVQTGMNPLHAVEMTVIVFGTAWWIFVISQLLDTLSTIGELFSRPGRQASTTAYAYQQQSLFSSIKSIFTFSLSPRSSVRKPASDYQQAICIWVCMLGILLGFVVMIMSISGHTSQMIKKQQTTYLESFGPQVGTNFTTSANGVITASDYWGNETSWSDCFIVRAPGSRNGFWEDWVESNRKGSALFRIAAGL